MKRFKDHPYVRKAVAARRVTSSLILFTKMIDAYTGEARSYKLLTETDEQRLFGQINKGVELLKSGISLDALTGEDLQIILELVAARQVVFVTNTRLTVNIVRKKYSKSDTAIPLIDLVNTGNEGLAIAINRFDVSRGFKFSTFATRNIEDTIKSSLANDSRMVRISSSDHWRYLKVRQELRDIEKSAGRELTFTEKAELLKMTPKALEKILRQGEINHTSLNKPVGDGELSGELGDFLEDHNNPGTSDEFERVADQSELAEIIANSQLSNRERFLLGLRFGLAPAILGACEIETKNGSMTYEEAVKLVPLGEGLSYEKIGILMGVTKEAIRQTVNKVLARLQKTAMRRKSSPPGLGG
ncbi:MAG TPA: sigma-70 family RNA polymerase sigma factor [Candidatus Saccharimonadales bacterium]